MDGLFTINRALSMETVGDDELSLIAKHGNLEVMRQYISAGALVWLTPGDGKDSFEFFMVHEGEIEIGEGEECRVLKAGDCFYTTALEKEVPLRCIKDTLLLYVTDTPIFDEEAYWQKTLQNLLTRIDETDHYTLRHSRTVMRLSMSLRERMPGYCTKLDSEAFAVGTLFHDVGKCKTPVEILRKPSGLTDEEFKVIKQHPIASGDILRPRFGEGVADLASTHHERLDGTGYPLGLSGDKISPEARILMVADSFDAITSKRTYNEVRSYMDAVNELRRFPLKYDMRVVDALQSIVKDGSVQKCSEHLDTDDI